MITSFHPTAIVDSQTCHQLKNAKTPFLLILKKGEMVHDTLISCAESALLKGAVLTGIGALRNPILGIFNEETKQYDEKKFTGLFELLNLSGNLAKADNKFIAHLHVTLSDDEYNAFGGHLISAKVGVTAEILITPLPQIPIRSQDKETGLKLIKP